MKTLIKTLFVTLLFFAFDAAGQSPTEKVLLRTTAGDEIECYILESTKSMIRIKKPNGSTSLITNTIIESINGIPFEQYSTQLTPQKNIAPIDAPKSPFAKSLSQSGGLIAGGAGLILIGTGFSVFGVVEGDSKALIYAGGASALVGTVLILAGGLKLAAAAEEYSKFEFGKAKRKVLKYEIGGTYASVSLRF
jgi:hypothetical protein